MKALLCIPTYNEKDNVLALVESIFSSTRGMNFEILFIDDGSPDGTGTLLDEISQSKSKVHVIHRKGKLGLASAYIKGFEWGLERGFDWIMEMDADFSHDPKHLAAFYSEMLTDQSDALCGSRYILGGGVSNWGRERLILSRAGSLYSRIWLQFPIQDWTGGFNAWRADLLREMKLSTIQSKGYAFQIELKYRCQVLNRRLKEIPIVFQERRAGQSKMSGSIVKEALLGVVRLRLREQAGTLFN